LSCVWEFKRRGSKSNEERKTEGKKGEGKYLSKKIKKSTSNYDWININECLPVKEHLVCGREVVFELQLFFVKMIDCAIGIQNSLNMISIYSYWMFSFQKVV
jgi:hypothetical protein